ncbi:MAG: DNA recombination protein RmuC [Clostridia bacterium]|nr:DNA recombination protein RmuC [Clostridia bacterium]
MEILLYICLALLALVTGLLIAVLVRQRRYAVTGSDLSGRLERLEAERKVRDEGMRRELKEQQDAAAAMLSLRQEAFMTGVSQALDAMKQLMRADGEAQRKLFELNASAVSEQLRAAAEAQSALSAASGKAIGDTLKQLEQRLGTFSTDNEQKLENIRSTVSRHLTSIQEENNRRLDEMKQIVDEKLQKTLEDNMARSFKMVSERLEQVYKGLGEMQTLATGVGDLKKVLANVKTRGILGEIQLGAILEEVLAPEQYELNAQIKRNTFVEFAIKLPGEDDKTVLLPIDSKFPMEAYQKLLDAYDSASPGLVKSAGEELKQALKKSAQDIRDKYIVPPLTTAYAIMFLPTEGLYAEAVKLGLIEAFQRDYKVNIAGPSTMAALLNSLQMGFRSYLVHKRSGEVWNVLNEVKTEFEKFADALAAAQQRIEQANTELDTLVGTRTRQLRRKLGKVAAGASTAELEGGAE